MSVSSEVGRGWRQRTAAVEKADNPHWAVGDGSQDIPFTKVTYSMKMRIKKVS